MQALGRRERLGTAARITMVGGAQRFEPRSEVVTSPPSRAITTLPDAPDHVRSARWTGEVAGCAVTPNADRRAIGVGRFSDDGGV